MKIGKHKLMPIQMFEILYIQIYFDASCLIVIKFTSQAIGCTSFQKSLIVKDAKNEDFVDELKIVIG